MNALPKDLNLLELRKSDRDQLIKALAEKSPAEIENLKRNIENTLSRFTAIVPENEEQVYLFGIDVHHVLKAAGIKPTHLGEIRDHLNPSVRVVFVCGLLGLNLQDTKTKLAADRKQRLLEQKIELAARKRRQHESETGLVEDIKELFSDDRDPSLVPPDIIPRR
jgi:hypothetical protein